MYYENTTNEVFGNFLNTSFDLYLTYGSYLWNCLGYDNNSNSAYASSNFSITINPPTYPILSSPSNNGYINSSDTNFTCIENTTNELVNSTLFLWNSTQLLYNDTINISGVFNQTVFNYTPVSEGNYSWNCNVYDNTSYSDMAYSNFTIVYDNTPPLVTVISPDDKSMYTGTSEINFQYNVSEINPNSCSLVLNGTREDTNSSINTNITNDFADTLYPGSYNWSISCTDLAGNSNETTSRTLTVNSLPTSYSGTGGGGGAVAPIIMNPTIETLSSSELQQGVNRQVKKYDKLLFTINNNSHSILLANLTNDSVVITLSSTPTNISLVINETRYIDLNSDNVYDLKIRLNSITGNQASLTITEISEPIPTEHVSTNETTNNTVTSKPIAKNNNLAEGIVAVLILLFIILFIISLIREKSKKKRKRSRIKIKVHSSSIHK